MGHPKLDMLYAHDFLAKLRRLIEHHFNNKKPAVNVRIPKDTNIPEGEGIVEVEVILPVFRIRVEPGPQSEKGPK